MPDAQRLYTLRRTPQPTSTLMPAPVAATEAPAAPAEPAPLPTALPNTAGETAPLWVLALIALLVVSGALVRRLKVEG